jgi:hypothetical protein
MISLPRLPFSTFESAFIGGYHNKHARDALGFDAA